jgi:hypothetical protein
MALVANLPNRRRAKPALCLFSLTRQKPGSPLGVRGRFALIEPKMNQRRKVDQPAAHELGKTGSVNNAG